MDVGVIGTGYVGLVSGVCLAAKGHSVTCYDVRTDVVARLNNGEIHLHEPGLPALLAEVRAAGRFHAATMSVEALEKAGHDLVMIAVGTPSTDGKIDLAQIRDAARMIGLAIAGSGQRLPVVVKSTVVPGTTDTVVAQVIAGHSKRSHARGEFGLGMNPEFLREGKAVEDFMDPDRVVIGFEDELTRDCLRRLYAPWNCEMIEVNTRTAEMIKYANNCLLALQISAANELANVASALGGVDIAEVMRGVHSDKRWSPIENGKRQRPGILEYLKAGCGFGGSCFPKDVQAMRTLARDTGVEPRLLQATLDVNDDQPGQVTRLLEKALLDGVAGKKVLLLGCAFKADTDDIRESVSLRISRDLLKKGALVLAHDPIALDNFMREFPAGSLQRVENWREALIGADAVIVATAWPEYQTLPEEVSHLVGKALVDARRVWSANKFPGVNYLTIGYAPRAAETN